MEDSDPSDKPSSESTAKKPTFDSLVHAKDTDPELQICGLYIMGCAGV
jgi:hypothetical protein